MLNATNLYLGKTDEGAKVYVDVRIEKQDGEHETTDHRTVVDPLRLSISGCEYMPGDRWNNPSSCGQIDMHLGAADFTESPLSGDELAEFFALWDAWHLNDMQAPCEHQVNIRVPYGYGPKSYLRPNARPGKRTDEHKLWQYLAARQTRRCPDGYRYGSKWLVKPLPAEVIGLTYVLVSKLPARA